MITIREEKQSDKQNFGFIRKNESRGLIEIIKKIKYFKNKSKEWFSLMKMVVRHGIRAQTPIF